MQLLKTYMSLEFLKNVWCVPHSLAGCYDSSVKQCSASMIFTSVLALFPIVVCINSLLIFSTPFKSIGNARLALTSVRSDV